MTQAENHELLLNGARGISEFNRALQTAKNESVVEEFDEAIGWGMLTFADGSKLGYGVEDRIANVYTAEDEAAHKNWAEASGL